MDQFFIISNKIRSCARHESGLLFMKTIKIALLVVLTFFLTNSCTETSTQTYLEGYYNEIDRRCTGFELLSDEEIENSFHYSQDLGEVSCMIAPNSHEKFLVLGTLSAADFVYAKLMTPEDDIEKCRYLNIYIEDGENGTALLSVYCGRGSGDMVVTLFKGASKERYIEAADSIIEDYVSRFDLEFEYLAGG